LARRRRGTFLCAAYGAKRPDSTSGFSAARTRCATAPGLARQASLRRGSPARKKQQRGTARAADTDATDMGVTDMDLTDMTAAISRLGWRKLAVELI